MTRLRLNRRKPTEVARGRTLPVLRWFHETVSSGHCDGSRDFRPMRANSITSSKLSDFSHSTRRDENSICKRSLRTTRPLTHSHVVGDYVFCCVMCSPGWLASWLLVVCRKSILHPRRKPASGGTECRLCEDAAVLEQRQMEQEAVPIQQRSDHRFCSHILEKTST